MSEGMDAVNAAMVGGGMLGPNIYSRFQGKRIPQPGYNGTPTDALGHPIAAPMGMTLNSTPAPAAPAPANTGWNQNPVGSPLNPTGDWTQLAPQLPGANAQQQANYGYNLGLGGFIDPSTKQAYVQPAQPAAASSASAGPPPSSLDNAIQMLSNPGKVTTPGANPGSTGGADGSSILSSFLGSNSAGSPGAGGYSNKGFFDTLNALRSGGSPPTAAGTAPTPTAPVGTPGMTLNSTPMSPAPAGPLPPVDPNASVITLPHAQAPKVAGPMAVPKFGPFPPPNIRVPMMGPEAHASGNAASGPGGP